VIVEYYKAITEKLEGYIKKGGCLKHKPEWGSIKARWWSGKNLMLKIEIKNLLLVKNTSRFIYKTKYKCALTGVN
jgi:hypothetical protein